MKIEGIEGVKIEEGDFVLVTVPENTPHRMVRRFQEVMELKIRKELHVSDFSVAVVGAKPGEVSIQTTKRNELNDIYQRLDDLEKKVG